jgi:hypothetical protein
MSSDGTYDDKHKDEIERNLVKYGELYEKTGDDVYLTRMNACKDLLKLFKPAEPEKNPGMA